MSPFPIATIDSIKHAWVIRAARLARDRDFRKAKDRALIGGHHIVQEYIQRVKLGKVMPPTRIVLTEKYLLKYKPQFKKVETISIKDDCLQHITREATSEGILAEIPLPKPQQKDLNDYQRVLGLISTRIPGNLGCLVRSALAFKWDSVWLMESCVDPYSYESIRCSKGASLYADYRKFASVEEAVELLKLHGIAPVIAVSGEKRDPSKAIILSDNNIHASQIINLENKIALILGSESSGIPERVLQDYDITKISIDISGAVESLNVAVAGGILMSTLR